MSRIRVNCFAVSADGFGAGPGQSPAHPLGVGGEGLMRWFFPTRTFRRVVGGSDGADGTTGVDDGFAARSFDAVGAWVMGRNMFAPSRGPWPDDGWRGWWGNEPPYHCPVFVLTHHARPPLTMAGGTVFHFVTDGLASALERARTAAGGRDVRIGGGAATVRAALAGGLIDEMHVALSPVLLGRGEPLWAGLDLPALGYAVAESVAGEAATHLVIRRL